MADNDNDGDNRKSVNIEVPGAEKTRYVSVHMPHDQYDLLDDIKDRYGFTWRGLLMHAHRNLGSPNEDSEDQYEELNKTRQRHGFTWKGMLLYAARDLEDTY